MNFEKKKLHIIIAIAAVSLCIFLAVCAFFFLGTPAGNNANLPWMPPADVTAPSLTLNGEEYSRILLGTTYTDPGATAIDDVDGDITEFISVNGVVDTATVGIYTLTYVIADSSENTSTVTRTVEVALFQTEEQMITPPGKVVYLTFDDGPGQYTEQLLNLLDKYNVKVTFFVTNQYQSYQHLIGEAHRRGHTIAMHTYSHRFQSIYTSEAAYYNDLNQIRAICEAQTGVTPKIVRFPGGTSNTISRKYCSRIMSTLTRSIEANGYLYCDWNVDSYDAGGATTREMVATNILAGIQKYNHPIVLQHDTLIYSVEAVEDVLIWGLQNGYTFLGMDENTPMAHHKANN